MLSEATCPTFSRLLQSSLSCRGNQVRWHAETFMVIRFCFFLRLSQSPFPSRDKRVRWHVETIMVIRFFCFQDYYSLLCLPETIKSVVMRRQSWSFAFVVFQDYHSLFCLLETIRSVGMRRQSWSSTFVIFKTITVFFGFHWQLSLLAWGTISVFRSLSFLRLSESFLETSNVSLTLQDFKVFCWHTWCLLCSFFL